MKKKRNRKQCEGQFTQTRLNLTSKFDIYETNILIRLLPICSYTFYNYWLLFTFPFSTSLTHIVSFQSLKRKFVQNYLCYATTHLNDFAGPILGHAAFNKVSTREVEAVEYFLLPHPCPMFYEKCFRLLKKSNASEFASASSFFLQSASTKI